MALDGIEPAAAVGDVHNCIIKIGFTDTQGGDTVARSDCSSEHADQNFCHMIRTSDVISNFRLQALSSILHLGMRSYISHDVTTKSIRVTNGYQNICRWQEACNCFR